jgi:hypothetical protein
LLFIFALEYAIRRVQINQDGLKLKGTRQLLVYADDINIVLGGSQRTVKKNPEALVVAIKENVLEVNADKTKYIVMSRDQNTERSHNIILIIVPLKGWNSSNIWEPSRIKIVFRKKLRADRNQGMLAIIRHRTLCLPICYPKI